MSALTPKQEAFCIAYLETGNASEAYRRSYDCEGSKPEVINVNASKLLADDKIALRLEELRAPIIKRMNITAEDLIRELDEARQAALENGAYAPAVSATMGKAKILGFDKQVIDHMSSDGSMRPQPTRIELVAPSVDTKD